MTLEQSISRRGLLKGGLAAAAAIGMGGGLTGCGGNSSNPTSSSPGTVPAKRGGTLRVGVTGGGSDDTLDAGEFLTNVDGLRIFQLYNSLYAFDKNVQPQLCLAQEATPNSSGTEWTVRLRSGITFHDGKPLQAEDVIYTFQRVLDPKNNLLGIEWLKPLDIANAKVMDPLTVRLPFNAPFGYFPECMATYFYFIVPVGYNPRRPIGTGPFKYSSFTPGQQSVFTRNHDYWQPGFPYVDELQIVDFADETSQLEALASGAIDLAGALSGASVSTVTSQGGKVLVESGEAYTPFTMRMDKPPFNDIRVRQAFRLLVDRPQMNELLFNGLGAIGNDLFCRFDKTYDSDLPQRHQDIPQARFLLKQAGYDNDLTISVVGAEVAAGAVQGCTVLAQQAASAGVKITVSQVPVATLYGPNYLQWTFALDQWNYNPYLLNAEFSTIPTGIVNECHVNYPPYTRLWYELAAATDLNRQIELTHEMQTMEYEGHASGYIIPYFVPSITGMRQNVHGLTPSKIGNPLGGFDLQTVWLT